jgi:hypothetical protein
MLVNKAGQLAKTFMAYLSIFAKVNGSYSSGSLLKLADLAYRNLIENVTSHRNNGVCNPARSQSEIFAVMFAQPELWNFRIR